MSGIIAEDVRFGYSRNDPILAGLSFEFPAGHMSAVTGSSGQGKSTLLYLLGLLLRPWSGRILFDGQDAAHLPDRERSRIRAASLGFVFQDAALDSSRSVLDNVLEGAIYRGSPRRDSEPQAQALLARFGVDLRSDHRPGEVSGGQAQRVALCRALLGNPAAILADEPSGNLDLESAATVMDALREAASAGAVVVVASHDPLIVDECDLVLDL
ncbi:MAG: ATP-binding cassette domain-containing protein [Acidimicrobiia bacterium]|nr:ATP-binding cassette domain-containing protein [Acidimicrobiia bacterium]NNF08951.1 ATP-binding cassette domain-containing protein [Acidimicrobiia bacterium]NNL71343.1 ATP-binding cassette domain-containing protein [Acidimicrobiia bacterium]